MATASVFHPEPGSPAEKWIADGWRYEKCPDCNGHGLRHVCPGDVEECRTCGYEGRLWVSPTGRMAVYPGGPFLGRQEAA